MILNIGCGYNKIKDAVNLDIDPRCNPDIIADLSQSLPFEDNYFNYIYASQVLEHVFNYEDLMIELHRVLELKGKLYIGVPMWPSRNCIAGPGHIRQFVPESILMFTDPTFFQAKGSPCDYQGLFDKIKMKAEKIPIAGDEPGAWITSLEAILMKVDKSYWKEKGVTKGLKTDVKGCFWCGYELEFIFKSIDNKLGKKICPNCKEEYTFEM